MPNNNKKSDSKDQSKEGFGEVLNRVYDFFKDLIDLKEGMDKEGTIINIKNNKRQSTHITLAL